MQEKSVCQESGREKGRERIASRSGLVFSGLGRSDKGMLVGCIAVDANKRSNHDATFRSPDRTFHHS